MLKALFPAVFLLSACGGFSVPVVGQLSNGEQAQGWVFVEAVEGSFELESNSGLSCRGVYDTATRARQLNIPVTCNDGATGLVVATRDASLSRGTATAQLSNGLTGSFKFGNMTAAQRSDFLDGL